MEKPNGVWLQCFYGDDDAVRQRFDPKRVPVIPRPGGHRIGSDDEPIAKAILKEVK